MEKPTTLSISPLARVPNRSQSTRQDRLEIACRRLRTRGQQERHRSSAACQAPRRVDTATGLRSRSRSFFLMSLTRAPDRALAKSALVSAAVRSSNNSVSRMHACVALRAGILLRELEVEIRRACHQNLGSSRLCLESLFALRPKKTLGRSRCGPSFAISAACEGQARGLRVLAVLSGKEEGMSEISAFSSFVRVVQSPRKSLIFPCISTRA